MKMMVCRKASATGRRLPLLDRVDEGAVAKLTEENLRGLAAT